MAIVNLGSINIDYVYSVAALPRPGETITASELTTGLGGKGANQSIAAARAGATVRHVGAVGPNTDWALSHLRNAGVDTDQVARLDIPTGHAMITVDQDAENVIVLFKGANHAITEAQIDRALAEAQAGEWLLLQNETNMGVYAARQARKAGLKVAYCAAPFDPDAVRALLPFTDLLSVNQIEAQQVRDGLPDMADALDRITWLTTLGAEGARYDSPDETITVPARRVQAVDTTGAGDTFLGYALAGLDAGLTVKQAMQQATAAAAIAVTRAGASAAIPGISEVREMLAQSEEQA